MPRSGTSLIEQIISSHSRVYGAGELNFITNLINKKFIKNDVNFLKEKIENFKKKEFDELKNEYLESLKRYNFNEKYLIDKAPLNFKWIGFIFKSLPNSKIIHCNRNNMDICWSNYKNFFSSKKINYSYNFHNLGEYYKLYENLMTFWNSIYKDKIYNISYEKLTDNPEEEIKKLIKYCGLDWEENCLNFHKNKKSVTTASLAQIREPIYKSSVKNWENYLEKVIYEGLFIELKNSVLLLVFFNFELINSIASIVPIGAIILRKTFIFWRSFLSKINSSLLVPDLVISIAG